MKRPGSLLVLCGLFIAWSAASADTSTGLLAYYPFPGGAADSSGNGNHGTPNATVVLTGDRFGNPGAAYEFNGLDSYITVPNSETLSSPTTAVTQAAWILLYGTSKVGHAFDPILMKSVTADNAFMYRLYVQPDLIGVAFNNWWNIRSTAQTLELHRWYFVAGTYDGSLVRFYLDGAQVDSTALSLTMVKDSRPLMIGGDVPGYWEIFWGKIDEVRIYGRALSAADIGELYLPPSTAVEVPPEIRFLAPRVAPNPSAGTSRIGFALSAPSAVELTIYDVLGRTMRRLARGPFGVGPHSVTWDGRDDSGAAVPAGLYLCWLRAGDAMAATRFVRIH